MCLYPNFEKDAPTRTKVFYKVVTARGRYTEYYPTKYPVGEVIVAKPRDLAGHYRDLVVDRRLRWNHVVYGGAIHLYATKKRADNAVNYRETLRRIYGKRNNPILMVVRCRCRPRHFIAWGFDGDVAYTQVEVLD